MSKYRIQHYLLCALTLKCSFNFYRHSLTVTTVYFQLLMKTCIFFSKNKTRLKHIFALTLQVLPHFLYQLCGSACAGCTAEVIIVIITFITYSTIKTQNVKMNEYKY